MHGSCGGCAAVWLCGCAAVRLCGCAAVTGCVAVSLSLLAVWLWARVCDVSVNRVRVWVLGLGVVGAIVVAHDSMQTDYGSHQPGARAGSQIREDRYITPL